MKKLTLLLLNVINIFGYEYTCTLQNKSGEEIFYTINYVYFKKHILNANKQIKLKFTNNLAIKVFNKDSVLIGTISINGREGDSIYEVIKKSGQFCCQEINCCCWSI